MDLATLIGFIAGSVIILMAIVLGGDAATFVNVPSILVVVGGTAAATFMKFPMADCIYALKTGVGMAFKDDMQNPSELVERIKDLANRARKDGLLALEDEPVNNEFFQKGIQLCVDGQQPEFVKKVLDNDMEKSIERMELGAEIYQGIGDAAPAFGMIGT
ncbi:MAG: MotA/TolQ/ExbB proton channel family protein, partial [Gammaproteobacteria bacterium]|nr:MotA/TolQ/ExbB proton channel family protein [Gammaproteobacteria bacterium]